MVCREGYLCELVLKGLSYRCASNPLLSLSLSLLLSRGRGGRLLKVVAIDVLSETRDISTDDSQASVVTAHPPPTSSDVGRAAPAKPNGTADANKSPVIHPCSIVAAHEEVEESSFMPSEYRSESDSAMRRWEKRDLIRQEDVNIGGGAFGGWSVVSFALSQP